MMTFLKKEIKIMTWKVNCARNLSDTTMYAH